MASVVETSKTTSTNKEATDKAKIKSAAVSNPVKMSSKADKNAPMDMLAELAAIKSGNASSGSKTCLHDGILPPNFDLNKSNDLDLPERDGFEVAAQIMAHASVKTNEDQIEENILDLIGQEDDQSDDGNTESDYDPALDLPNPGEVIEEKDSIVKDFMTKLNFTAHVRDAMEDVSSQVTVNNTLKPAHEQQVRLLNSVKHL